MTDIPVICSAPMVHALLREAEEEGTGKTMTRRLASRKRIINSSTTELIPSSWRSVVKGDRLWVREMFWAFGRWQGTKKAGKVGYTFERRIHAGDLRYGADVGDSYLPIINNRGLFGQSEPAWHRRPAIFMEKQHSRLTLVVTGTKIERLNDISENDCEREGCVWHRTLQFWNVPGVSLPSGAPVAAARAQDCFAALWDTLHGSGAWLADPEVVVITFKVRKVNIDAPEEPAT